MPGGVILLFILIAILVIAGAIYAHRKQRERIAALVGLAERIGWQFTEAKDWTHDQQFGQFSVFTQGHTKYAYNTLSGNLEIANQRCRAQMGDYHYQTTSSNGKQTTTHTHLFSYLLVTLPYAVPSLTIRQEGLFDRIASFIGFDDIDFESAEFSDRFHVKCADKRFAYDVIHPRMMEFLLEQPPQNLEFEAGVCCLYNPGKCWSPSEFDSQLRWIKDFFEHWPLHLTSTLQAKL